MTSHYTGKTICCHCGHYCDSHISTCTNPNFPNFHPSPAQSGSSDSTPTPQCDCSSARCQARRLELAPLRSNFIDLTQPDFIDLTQPDFIDLTQPDRLAPPIDVIDLTQPDLNDLLNCVNNICHQDCDFCNFRGLANCDCNPQANQESLRNYHTSLRQTSLREHFDQFTYYSGY